MVGGKPERDRARKSVEVLQRERKNAVSVHRQQTTMVAYGTDYKVLVLLKKYDRTASVPNVPK